jgi:hypothetical protein
MHFQASDGWYWKWLAKWKKSTLNPVSATSSMIESSKTSAQKCNNCNGNKFQLSHKDCSSNSCTESTKWQTQSTSVPTTSCGTKIYDLNGSDVENQVVMDNVSPISQMSYTQCQVGSNSNANSLITCTPQHLTKSSSTTIRNINLHLDCTENNSEKCYTYNSRNVDANNQRMHDLDMNSAQTLQNSIVHPTNNHANLTQDSVKESSSPSNGFQVNVMIYYIF